MRSDVRLTSFRHLLYCPFHLLQLASRCTALSRTHTTPARSNRHICSNIFSFRSYVQLSVLSRPPLSTTTLVDRPSISIDASPPPPFKPPSISRHLSRIYSHRTLVPAPYLSPTVPCMCSLLIEEYDALLVHAHARRRVTW